jgi:hypothetical protein
MTSDLTNIVMFAGGFVLLVCAVLVVRRTLTKFSSASVRKELTVSREWLLEHQAKKSGDS